MQLKKKTKVNSDLVGRTLEYVTERYGLTSNYSLNGFKKGKNDLQISVANDQAELTVKIYGSDMYDLLDEDNFLDNTEDEE